MKRMKPKRGGWLAANRECCASILAATVCVSGILSLVACDENRLSLAGDVRDTAGRPVEGCKAQLVVQTPAFGGWTGTISREAATDSAGRFSFSVLVVHRSTYRLRIEHPGYQEWLHEGTWPGAPRRYHITLRRQAPAEDGAPAS